MNPHPATSEDASLYQPANMDPELDYSASQRAEALPTSMPVPLIYQNKATIPAECTDIDKISVLVGKEITDLKKKEVYKALHTK